MASLTKKIREGLEPVNGTLLKRKTLVKILWKIRGDVTADFGLYDIFEYIREKGFITRSDDGHVQVEIYGNPENKTIYYGLNPFNDSQHGR